MKKHIEKIKRQAKDEAMKTGLVILGAVGGLVLSKFARKYTAEHPTMDAVAKYGIPALLAGGGFILAAATDTNSKAKYFGYGLSVAGAIEGIKIIPVAKDYLSGILGETDINAASAFYTESEERQKQISGFGLASLPVGNASMQEVQGLGVNLPELEGLGYNESIVEGLGYNADQTDLGFNASQTDDDFKGIL
jgi:hypothetical protein